MSVSQATSFSPSILAGGPVYVGEIPKDKAPTQHVILFYKYHPLSPEASITDFYRKALERLCISLSLTGRILVGYSETEGINGTLAGSRDDLKLFTFALLGDSHVNPEQSKQSMSSDAVKRFWQESKEFFKKIEKPELRIESSSEFKWSVSHGEQEVFPDLNVKLVKELISSGQRLCSISLDEISKGYLSPAEWHKELLQLGNFPEESVLVDCRNSKEYAIGRFEGAIDPGTTTFAQFPRWVDNHSHLLANKKVLMYCTGGIRCEKASAYIRKVVPSIKDVCHLKGGIHKYLEQFGDESHLWKGRNFVFDSRVATSAKETRPSNLAFQNQSSDIEGREPVGECLYCKHPYDKFQPDSICTVCREPLLVCDVCKDRLSEYHCNIHFHLQTCYFSNVNIFSIEELKQQKEELEVHLSGIAIGRRFRQKRRTLMRQMTKIDGRVKFLESEGGIVVDTTKSICRSCGSDCCNGRCWGFFGLKRKLMLDGSYPSQADIVGSQRMLPTKLPRLLHAETRALLDGYLWHRPCEYRDFRTGVRVPPCTTRILETFVKAKWCGQSALQVVKSEFTELRFEENLHRILDNGLLLLNDSPVRFDEIADTKLKLSDKLSRLVHWHEAPVIVPDRISALMYGLPHAVVAAYCNGSNTNSAIYACNKPASVPVHPAGPYFSNALTVLVEAQEGLPRNTLTPLHRIDRSTSGLTLCSVNPDITRAFQRSLQGGMVKKLYIAKVQGIFPSKGDEVKYLVPHAFGEISWSTDKRCIVVKAPILTSDPANGVREVNEKGKPSESRFQLLAYDDGTHTSLIACCPVTGRSHQLRVHLQMIGFPILNDCQYGGAPVEACSLVAETAVDAMLARAENSTTGCTRSEPVTCAVSQNVDAAVRRGCCVCCKGRAGILGSFTSSQLLFDGGAIFLHSFRYAVEFLSPRKGESKRVIGHLEFEVSLPEWINGQLEKDEVVWII